MISGRIGSRNPPEESTFRRIIARRVCITVLSLALTSTVGAQTLEELSREASFAAGASLRDGGSALALTAALGFRFSPRVGAVVEIAHARKLDFTLDVCPPPLVCVLGGRVPVTGRNVSMIPHVAIQLLPTSRRLHVYAQAGVGVGHVRQRYFFGPPFSRNIAERTRSNLTPALSFGGGAAMRISRRIAVGGDVRSLHLLDDAPTPERFITPSGTLSTLRVGSRVSWRF